MWRVFTRGVVGEKIPPGWVYGLLVLKELLIQLINEPIVCTKWTICWSGHGLGAFLVELEVLLYKSYRPSDKGFNVHKPWA